MYTDLRKERKFEGKKNTKQNQLYKRVIWIHFTSFKIVSFAIQLLRVWEYKNR